MAIDLPEAHARALDCDRWHRRRGARRPVERAERLRRLDGPRAGEPHRGRQLVGGAAGRGPDDRPGRRPIRRRRARRRSRRRLRRRPCRRPRRPSAPPGRWRRRWRCRTARCRARSTAGTGSSTSSCTGGTSPPSTGQPTALDPELVDVALEVVEPQIDLLAASGMFGTRAEAPAGSSDEATPARHARPVLNTR